MDKNGNTSVRTKKRKEKNEVIESGVKQIKI